MQQMLADAKERPTSVRDDRDEYQFLARNDAAVHVRLDGGRADRKLLISGNRAGLLALANVLLWLVANAYRREFLSLAELPFVRLAGAEHVVIRVSADDGDGRDGLLKSGDGGEQVEWEIAEEDLQRVALMIHRIVSQPEHEYERLRVGDGSDAGVEVRLSDVGHWV
jgi:hypothetical protein